MHFLLDGTIPASGLLPRIMDVVKERKKEWEREKERDSEKERKIDNTTDTSECRKEGQCASITD